ncbi:MAG TPA: maltose alpha-D-glucosyltransferase [Candidatus Dormibacteraeota bacterium]
MSSESRTGHEWYKDAVIYEAHVRAFFDSNDDGIGDFPGLIAKLDYLQELGVTAIWLLPFYPSPLKDDGYDIADYRSVNPQYGTLRDVRRLVREAHRRGLRVITELVCNHTSDQHPWFQRSRRSAPGSPLRDFYVWSDTPDKYTDARIIFKDFEASNWTWDPVAKAYYWHRFYSHQPDLNFDNEQVQQAILKVLDFWLEMGVDGVRLDAIPYLYEREGTTSENLPETHEFLRKMRAFVDSRYLDRMLLAEANQWPEDAVSYFGRGDECHMCFHFPLMPRMFMAIRMEDRFPISDILAQTPTIPENCQWALFLRNHDELTLEMVTDEERDYMYRSYTQDPEARINLGIRRRLAPLLSNNRRRIELMNALLCSLPGTPVIYYGDEIGMGDNIYLGDRDGVRTPMQWSNDRNAGFSRSQRQRLYLPVISDAEYHYEAVNVDAQRANQQSLLHFMQRLIQLRKRHAAFGRGTLQMLHPENRKILAFVRRLGDEVILVVANLSRFVQFVELDLAEFRDHLPVEMFGSAEFPVVSDRPYFLSLGPHAWYWFSLQPQKVAAVREPEAYDQRDTPELVLTGSVTELFEGDERQQLTEVLPSFLNVQRWFGAKSRRIKSAAIQDSVPLPYAQGVAHITVLEVQYVDGGEADTYLLPLATAFGARAQEIWSRAPRAVIARIQGPDGEGVLFDCLFEAGFSESLLTAIARRRRFRKGRSALTGTPTKVLRQHWREDSPIHAAPSAAEQSNNSVIFGEQLILKLYRRLESGTNPDLEVGRFLTEHTRFHNIAPVAGALEYRNDGVEPVTLAVLQAYVPNQGDAWQDARTHLEDYLHTVRESHREPPEPGVVQELAARYLEGANQLGRRTAEMHLALASSRHDPAFTPEPPSAHAQRSVYQAARTLSSEVFALLRSSSPALPEPVHASVQQLLQLEPAVLTRFQGLLRQPIRAHRIRIHGDYHLGQVLKTGDDFVIIDFEGEPARTLRERRLKRFAMKDVAGMLRSFDYAAHAVLFEVDDQDGRLDPWARAWVDSVSAAFLGQYTATAAGSSFLPANKQEAGVLLDAFLLEKALYELRYELNNRPAWLRIPVDGLLALLRDGD